jgi:hypothetical protein
VIVNRQSQGWIAWAGYVWLVFVGACVVAASWTGLVGFAEDILRLDGRARYIVPVSLDGLAVTLAFLGLRSVLAGDAAIFPRLLAWLVVAGGATANYYQAWHAGQGEAAAIYFGGMTLLVYLGFEVILRQLRREQLRAQGAVERPLPRFRLVRWLRFPLATFRAWSAAVEQGLTEPTDAVHAAALKRVEREQLAGLELDRERPAELEVTETRTRSIRARNGSMAAVIRDRYAAGEDVRAIVEATGFPPDTVARTIRRIEQQRSGS